MIKIKTFRFPETKRGIFGYFILNGQVYFTVERPWRNNEEDISCISAGRYILSEVASKTNRSAGLNVAYSCYVEGRKNIRFFHVANVPEEVNGCIGIGLAYNTVEEKVSRSVDAVKKFYSETDGEEIELEIVQL